MIGSLLSALAALSFLGIGAGAAVAPAALSENYGVPVEDAAGCAYVRALGARDAVLGLLVATFALRGERRALTTAVGLATFVGASDLAIVAGLRGAAARTNLAIHAAGTLGLAAAWLALRADR